MMRALFISLFAIFLAVHSQAAAPSPPNVVIIFCDDLGYADIGPFGCTRYATPNLDRLACEGRRFTSFHVSEAVCSASRASVLTGCYNNRIGIFNALNPTVRHGLNSSETTLAEIFKQKNYATGMAGKWHLGHLPPFLPIRHGFDEYYGLPYSNDMWPHGMEKKNRDYPPLPMIEGDKVIQADVTAEDQEQLTTRYTERAVDFIKRNHDRPFFFYLAHSMPHVPLYVSEKFKGKSGAGLYGDVIQEIDWSVGQVMDALKSQGIEDNTLVIFTSDNGPWLRYGDHAGSAGPLREGKGTSWEGGTRVPCVMRWPGHIPAGSSCGNMLMTIDLLPSLAELVGATLPTHTVDGLDVLPLIIEKPGAKNPHEAYWNYYADNQLQSVCTGDGRWKLVLPHTYTSLSGKPGGYDGFVIPYQDLEIQSLQLFDLLADVGEKTDVAAAHPEVVAKLEAAAEKARADLGDSLTNRTPTNIRPPGQVE
ncbi:MAG: sulfatase [Akkermansiaceae bacterium]|nr:sulfatase [Akkermansiaceae bacterium]